MLRLYSTAAKHSSARLYYLLWRARTKVRMRTKNFLGFVFLTLFFSFTVFLFLHARLLHSRPTVHCWHLPTSSLTLAIIDDCDIDYRYHKPTPTTTTEVPFAKIILFYRRSHTFCATFFAFAHTHRPTVADLCQTIANPRIHRPTVAVATLTVATPPSTLCL